MTREDVIRMARQVGFPMQHPDWQKAAEEFSALVAAAEREACAKVCESMPYRAASASKAAEAIRARGQQ